MLATPLLVVCYRLVCKSGSAARRCVALSSHEKELVYNTHAPCPPLPGHNHRHVVPRHVSPNVVEIRAPPLQQPNPPAAARAEGASALPGWGVEVVGAA